MLVSVSGWSGPSLFWCVAKPFRARQPPIRSRPGSVTNAERVLNAATASGSPIAPSSIAGTASPNCSAQASPAGAGSVPAFFLGPEPENTDPRILGSPFLANGKFAFSPAPGLSSDRFQRQPGCRLSPASSDKVMIAAAHCISSAAFRCSASRTNASASARFRLGESLLHANADSPRRCVPRLAWRASGHAERHAAAAGNPWRARPVQRRRRTWSSRSRRFG